MTLEERLAQLDKAITAALAAQEYRHEGRHVRRAELATLLKQRDRLEAEIARARGGDTSVAEFEGR